VFISLLTRISGLQMNWLSTLGTLALVSQPFLLLRLVQYLRPVRTAIVRAALVGMVLSWAALSLFPFPLSPIVTLLVIAYFAGIDGYAMVAFVHGALTSAGVVRQRLRFVAAGSGLLALALVLAGAGSVLPLLRDLTGPLTQVGAMLSAVTFYIGFAPPRSLRRTWQFSEVRNFLLQFSRKPVKERLSDPQTLLELARVAANLSVGGVMAAVAQENKGGEQWVFRYTSHPVELDGVSLVGQGVIERAVRENRPLFVRRSDSLGDRDRRLLDTTGADTLLIAPISTTERSWGLLLVFLRYGSLFVEDDLELVYLLAQQSALIVENSALVEELHRQNEDLEQIVAQRTAALRQSAEEIRELNAELEQRVADRTARLTAVNKELEAFSYSVSHDLRAPLRTLDGFSQALLEDYAEKLDENAKNYLNRIRAASQRMGQLIDDLIQLSRLARSEIQTEQVNLSEIASQFAAELRARHMERQVEFVIMEGLAVRGDQRLLRIALANLLENAWKFSSKKAHSCIEFGKAQHNGRDAFFVRDNGAGFDMAYADKLFGAFQRLHSMTEFDGTGIGLATVQRIINRHDGDIWAEGAVGQGATFYFSLWL
jgi:signal transduction histidine kinase